MQRVRTGRVTLFLLLTFGLSWGFNLLIAQTIGQKAYLELGMSPLGMFFPAFVAILLRLFVFKDDRLYGYKGKPRWILYSFLLLTVIYAVVTLMGVFGQGSTAVFQGVGNLLITLWMLLVFFVAGRSSKEEFEQAGLQLGDTGRGVKLLAGVVVFLALQAGLNLVFRLGLFQGWVEWVYGIPVSEGWYLLALIVALGITVTGIPLSGLAAVFGEEYGWRGFLQDELVRLGRRRGVFLVGLIWGLWHFPVILSGMHTYPPTSLGLVLGLVFFILWGFVQSYAVLKARSIWLAAFMHGLVNSLYAFILTYVVRPDDPVLSFGLGVYGLVCLAVVVVFILRDAAWGEEAGGREEQPAQVA